MLDIDASGVAPSLRYAKLGAYGLLQEREIDLKRVNGDLVFIPLEEGRYQITSVSAPYFDLPFRLDTKEEKQWQFTIEKKKLNYLGRVSVDKSRGRRYINVDLKNRISYHLPHLKAQYQLVLEKYPLRLASVFQDEFLVEYLR